MKTKLFSDMENLVPSIMEEVDMQKEGVVLIYSGQKDEENQAVLCGIKGSHQMLKGSLIRAMKTDPSLRDLLLETSKEFMLMSIFERIYKGD